MEMKTNLLIQIVLAAVLFVSVFLLSRSNSRAENELDSRKEEQ